MHKYIKYLHHLKSSGLTFFSLSTTLISLKYAARVDCSGYNNQDKPLLEWCYCHTVNGAEYAILYALSKPRVENFFKGSNYINSKYVETFSYSFTTSIIQQSLIAYKSGIELQSLKFVVKDSFNMICKSQSPFEYNIFYLLFCNLGAEGAKDLYDGFVDGWGKYNSSEKVIHRSIYLPFKVTFKTLFREWGEIALEKKAPKIVSFINVPLRNMGYDVIEKLSKYISSKTHYVMGSVDSNTSYDNEEI